MENSYNILICNISDWFFQRRLESKPIRGLYSNCLLRGIGKVQPEIHHFFADLFTTYANGTINKFDTKTEKELYQKSINNVRGVSFTSFEDAGRDALKKMVKKLDEKIFQEIILGLDSN